MAAVCPSEKRNLQGAAVAASTTVFTVGREGDRAVAPTKSSARLSGAGGDVRGPGCFAAFVAHELRAPIAIQRALVEVTLADPDADGPALREMGERVLASCMRQQRLIEALLDLARSRRGLARREPVDVATVAAEALRAHDLGRLRSVVALEAARTTGDPELLGQLAANLVSNAIRHNVAGGTVEVATHARSGRAILSIANTGPTVQTGELERLFQPFQRLARQPADAAEGLGLGLTVVQAIADAHRATVAARARRGGGLRIDISFPARPPGPNSLTGARRRAVR